MSQAFTKLILLSFVFLFSVQCSTAEEKYKPGRHYEILAEPLPTRNSSRIEVIEFFWFGCGHCFVLEASLKEWKKTAPESVDFLRYPVIWNKTVETHAKIFFISQLLNKPQIIDGVFKSIHLQQTMLASDQEIIPFLKTYGVTEEQYRSLGDSFGLKNNLRKAELFGMKYGIKGVPALIVNGKYRVVGNRSIGTEDLLDVVNFLIEKERKN
ncbi:thiol:disulfide interchange protein DsbA/DsbL [SAR86 cluster bacterium]|jgi:thiol:disulfide interchange protein DsbA|nr:thiol:disulfide interchange protein DsbA/DsbL [SAR86 cluster bacterium]